jgi:homospermidine synthase
MIGFGSIGRGTLPLIERHFEYDIDKFTVIEPEDTYANFLAQRGINFVQEELTEDNYRDILMPLLKCEDGQQAFCVNVSVDTSSLDIMKLCREMNVLYIDTVTEPWPGFYFGNKGGKENNAARTNYALRETVREEKRNNPGGTTAVSCCGANPGMVSWFVKEALLEIAYDTGVRVATPQSREEWAMLMQRLGVKGIHIAERDTQRSVVPKPMDTFINTWSAEGFISEGFQPAELGWGTHEKWMPPNSHALDKGC